MKALSRKVKESIIQQALNRGSKTLLSIARSNNIGLSTLSKWLRRNREGKPLSTVRSSLAAPEALSRVEQFNHVLATHALDDVSLGQYCREHGLYSHQITQWKEDVMSTTKRDCSAQNMALKKLKDENKELKRELRRKDKALAEASALLIMKKKADLIWGVDEDA